jgi:hypothetical protein
MNFGSKAYLAKHLKEFEDDHPLLILFNLNPKYMAYFDKLLEELDSIHNLSSKISQMKDPSNWQSIVSELEFARSIRELNPIFVPQKKGSPSTDVEINLSGERIYFEVKLLTETDEASRVYKEIWTIESDFLVEIAYESIDKEKADRLIYFVSNKIKDHQTGQFEIDGNEIKIRKKISVKSPRTALIMQSKEAFLIPLEPLRQKIFLDFFDKIPQFSTEKFVFWVIDVERRKYGHDFFRAVAHGNTVTDMTIGLKHYVGFEDIYKTYSKNPELFQGTDIVPMFTYPKKNGLFFLKEAECLNGLIVKAYGRTQFLLNPFANPQLDINIIRKLKNFFS